MDCFAQNDISLTRRFHFFLLFCTFPRRFAGVFLHLARHCSFTVAQGQWHCVPPLLWQQMNSFNSLVGPHSRLYQKMMMIIPNAVYGVFKSSFATHRQKETDRVMQSFIEHHQESRHWPKNLGASYVKDHSREFRKIPKKRSVFVY